MLNKCFACYRLNLEQTQWKLFEWRSGRWITNLFFFANCSTRDYIILYDSVCSVCIRKRSIDSAGQARNFERCFLWLRNAKFKFVFSVWARQQILSRKQAFLWRFHRRIHILRFKEKTYKSAKREIFCINLFDLKLKESNQINTHWTASKVKSKSDLIVLKHSHVILSTPTMDQLLLTIIKISFAIHASLDFCTCTALCLTLCTITYIFYVFPAEIKK